MKKGDSATLCMKKTLRLGDVLDQNIYSGKVLLYDEQAQCIYFQLESVKLTAISLDAIYECAIQTQQVRLECTGRVKERYQGAEGKTIKFEIENGFYKINLK